MISSITQQESWRSLLSAYDSYDFYHTFHYHRLNAAALGGVPYCFAYEKGDYRIALPLIVRAVRTETPGSDCVYDATSVYGYAGVLTSHDSMPSEVAEDFRSSLVDELKSLGVIAVFSRLHPWIGDTSVLAGLGSMELMGCTVYVDLARPEEEQAQEYSSSHKGNIAKLRKLGVECEISHSDQEMNRFIEVYRQSMHRVGATSDYFFSTEYFRDLMSTNDYQMNLFVCRLNKDMICGGLFASCKGVVQYHLSGTDSEFLKLAPTKLMLDSVRRWAIGSGHAIFHLGGGLGSDQDNLYRFKAGFSSSEAQFYIWKWILDEETYLDACSAAGVDIPDLDGQALYSGYFPAYRGASQSRSS